MPGILTLMRLLKSLRSRDFQYFDSVDEMTLVRCASKDVRKVAYSDNIIAFIEKGPSTNHWGPGLELPRNLRRPTQI